MFRKIVADKKKLGEDFNDAMGRIDKMLENMKGDHNQLGNLD